jgi:hypothetical protein
MRSGDLGDSLTPLSRLDQMYYVKMLYNFTFWMVGLRPLAWVACSRMPTAVDARW